MGVLIKPSMQVIIFGSATCYGGTSRANALTGLLFWKFVIELFPPFHLSALTETIHPLHPANGMKKEQITNKRGDCFYARSDKRNIYV